MLGAIASDMIGSAWEGSGEKRYDFPLFSEFSRYTDDTVMTIAVAVLDRRDYAEVMREIGARHPFAGYGRRFQKWLLYPEIGPPDSYGNGGAMRMSAIGLAAGSGPSGRFDESPEYLSRTDQLESGRPGGSVRASAAAIGAHA